MTVFRFTTTNGHSFIGEFSPINNGSTPSVGETIALIEEGFGHVRDAMHHDDRVRLAVARNISEDTLAELWDSGVIDNGLWADENYLVRAEIAKIPGEHLHHMLYDPVLEVATQAHMTLGTEEWDNFVASISDDSFQDEPVNLDDLDDDLDEDIEKDVFSEELSALIDALVDGLMGQFNPPSNEDGDTEPEGTQKEGRDVGEPSSLLDAFSSIFDEVTNFPIDVDRFNPFGKMDSDDNGAKDSGASKNHDDSHDQDDSKVSVAHALANEVLFNPHATKDDLKAAIMILTDLIDKD